MKKILVIGASGFLGKALIQELPKKFETIGTYNKNTVEGFVKLDINNPVELKKTLDTVSPEIVVLAAAEANVDAYETDASISAVQIHSAKIIAEWCKQNNALLVFVSSDAVFDGSNAPYRETDSAKPISSYGRNKLDIEKIAQKVKRHLVLRTSTLYGIPVSPDKFIGKSIIRLLRAESFPAAVDWIRTPTLTRDFALALIKLVEKKQSGLFHVAGGSRLSMYEIALAVAREFNANQGLVKKGSISEIKLPAKRGKDTSLSISKIESLGIRMSSIEEGLKYIHGNMKN